MVVIKCFACYIVKLGRPKVGGAKSTVDVFEQTGHSFVLLRFC